jgi:hypothetical protein
MEERVDTYLDNVIEFLDDYNNGDTDFNESGDCVLMLLAESIDIINDLTKVWE